MNTYPICYSPLYNLEIGDTQLRSVSEIAPKSQFLGVNTSPVIGYGFRACAKAICYSVNV